jgi:hypothetical protein
MFHFCGMKGMSICEASYELLTTFLRVRVSYLKNVSLSFSSEGTYVFSFFVEMIARSFENISALFISLNLKVENSP